MALASSCVNDNCCVASANWPWCRLSRTVMTWLILYMSVGMTCGRWVVSFLPGCKELDGAHFALEPHFPLLVLAPSEQQCTVPLGRKYVVISLLLAGACVGALVAPSEVGHCAYQTCLVGSTVVVWHAVYLM
eukprot:10801103-Ditylum_brightwellii.AAC.1